MTHKEMLGVVQALRDSGDEITIVDMKYVVIPAIMFERLEQAIDMQPSDLDSKTKVNSKATSNSGGSNNGAV